MTREEALKWIHELFEKPPIPITPDTQRLDIPAWDSLGHLMLMSGLDEKFGILASDDELRAMTKVGDILDLLQKAGKLQ